MQSWGRGQLSLAKYLLIAAEEDDRQLDAHNIQAFLIHMLQRVDWIRDLHFQTNTTIDTLDYSGSGLNSGSKLVIAARGKARRELSSQLPADLFLPKRFSNPQVALPGVLVVEAPAHQTQDDTTLKEFCRDTSLNISVEQFPLCILVDNAEFSSRTLNNFLWTTFTRSNPASDIDGIDSFVEAKHWGLPRQPGHRCENQAAACPSTDRRSGHNSESRTPSPRRAVRCMGFFDNDVGKSRKQATWSSELLIVACD